MSRPDELVIKYGIDLALRDSPLIDTVEFV